VRIVNLVNPKSMIFSSNAYLLSSNPGRTDNVNTLVDVGNDLTIIDALRCIPTPNGKKPIEQVILTHRHFDHTGLLPMIREIFDPVVYARSIFVEPDVVLEDGQLVKCGDRTFEVICTPGHSEDSICLYCQSDGILFVGDTPAVIQSPDVTYAPHCIAALARLCREGVRAIYFGHGDPITEGAQAALAESLRNVRAAMWALSK